MRTDSIIWPAILQHPGADELEYLADQQALNTWLGRSEVRLIDSLGARYVLTPQRALSRQGEMKLPEILSLVRAHTQQGICCTPKIGAATIADAIKLMASLPHD